MAAQAIIADGWIIWNAGSITNPNFVPKEIFPPALEVTELTETVYASRAACLKAINANGGPHNYSTAGAAGKAGTLSPASVIGGTGQAAQDIAGTASATDSLAGKVQSGTLWLRVAEAGIGGLLLYVGLRAMFPAQVGAVTAPVKNAAKVAKFI